VHFRAKFSFVLRCIRSIGGGGGRPAPSSSIRHRFLTLLLSSNYKKEFFNLVAPVGIVAVNSLLTKLLTYLYKNLPRNCKIN